MENGSLETRIRFYLEGVFLPGIGVIGILGKLCLVSYLYMPFGSICIIAGNILSLHILRTANLELKPGGPLSMTLLGEIIGPIIAKQIGRLMQVRPVSNG